MIHVVQPCIETHPAMFYLLFVIMLGRDVSNNLVYLTLPGNSAEQLAVYVGCFLAVCSVGCGEGRLTLVSTVLLKAFMRSRCAVRIFRSMQALHKTLFQYVRLHFRAYEECIYRLCLVLYV